MHSKLLIPWQLQQNPNYQATDIVLNSELSADEGQALQLQLLERWLNEGETLGGWKIGMTSGNHATPWGQVSDPLASYSKAAYYPVVQQFHDQFVPRRRRKRIMFCDERRLGRWGYDQRINCNSGCRARL